MLKIAILLSFTMALLGCANPFNQSLYLHIRTAHYLNPDLKGQTEPVVIHLFQLNRIKKFKQLSYQALIANPVKNLGAQLLDQQKIEVQPNTEHNMKIALMPDAHFLAIVASFRAITQAKWRVIHSITPAHAHKKQLLEISIDTAGINMNIHQKRSWPW